MKMDTLRQFGRAWMAAVATLLAVTCAGDPDGDPAHDAAAELEAETVAASPLATPFVVVTFNSGTSEGLANANPNDAYTPELAAWSDQWYGDGLAWSPAVEATRRFFDEIDPDVVVFQEIFHPDDCPDIPPEAISDFYCQGWSPGEPSVAQHVLGEGWQVMCHPGKPDKCAAVNPRFGSFEGCDAGLCLEGLFGTRVEDCGKGARVGRGVIALVGGGELTLVNYHGSSGFGFEEPICRTRQVEQVFVDLGDGEPGANGAVNLVMGDLNTDPGRLASGDASAARWNDFVGPGRDFHFITDVGEDATPTYAIVNIDHVISDQLEGACWAAGVDAGHAAVIQDRYFDHAPIVCTIALPGEQL
jgi:hypothetical protein